MSRFLRLGLSVFGLALLLSVVSVTNTQGQIREVLKRMDLNNKSLQSLKADDAVVVGRSRMRDRVVFVEDPIEQVPHQVPLSRNRDELMPIAAMNLERGMSNFTDHEEQVLPHCQPQRSALRAGRLRVCRC